MRGRSDFRRPRARDQRAPSGNNATQAGRPAVRVRHPRRRRRICRGDRQAVARLGFCRHILISGGPTWNNDDAEAFVLRARDFTRRRTRRRHPDRAAARPTPARTSFSRCRSSRSASGSKQSGSVIALGKVCTSVRYLMTLQRHWPEVEKMLFAVNYFGHPIEEWPRHPVTRERILRRMAQARALQGGGVYCGLALIVIASSKKLFCHRPA